MKRTSFENTLLLIIILLSFAFLGYAYYFTNDATMAGMILQAVIFSLTTVLNWKYGSSKSSSTKDDTIKSMQESAANAPTTIKAEQVTAENIETVNTNTVNTTT